MIYTIGYEGAALADFCETLAEVGVERVLDIRELPQSRRPGFSKRALAEALEGYGIEYVHEKALGDPKHGRDAARRGDYDEFRAIFVAHLERPEGIDALRRAAELVTTATTALLCYERDPRYCHRSIVGQRLEAASGLRVGNLGVRHGGKPAAGAIAGAAVRHP